MNVQFTDTFIKSLKKMAWHESRTYRFYSLFRYKIPKFFSNIWYFRKELWKHRSWDYIFTLMMISRSLKQISNNLEFYGHEIDETRLKKVSKIKRAIQIMDNIKDFNYISMAEEKLGKLYSTDWLFKETDEGLYEIVDDLSEFQTERNRSIHKLSHKLEKEEWNELWDIFKGQDIDDFKIYEESLSDEEKSQDAFYKWFDGSGMNSWWD